MTKLLAVLLTGSAVLAQDEPTVLHIAHGGHGYRVKYATSHMLFTLYGSGFGTPGESKFPVFDLQGTRVLVCYEQAPLTFNDGRQINAHMPEGLMYHVGEKCPVEVEVAGRRTQVAEVEIVTQSLGLLLFTLDAPRINGKATGETLRLPTAFTPSGQPIGPANYGLTPAEPGSIIVLEATGCNRTGKQLDRVLIGGKHALVVGQEISGDLPQGVCRVQVDVPLDLSGGLQYMQVEAIYYGLWVGARK
ncbi:MAG: hypothetical protein Q8R08_04670 [bacterium]|nr:hypothetical protein [bacterium]